MRWCQPLSCSGSEKKTLITKALLPTVYNGGKVASEAPNALPDQGSQRETEKHGRNLRRIFVPSAREDVWAN